MTARRILMLSYEYPPVGGGTGKATRATARELVRLGHEVAVVTSRFGELPEEETDEGVRVIRIPVMRRYINQANAIEVMSFAATGVWNAGAVLKKFQPDMSVAYLTLPCSPVAEAIRRKSGAPYLTLLRGQDVPGYPEMNPLLHKLAFPVTKYLWNRSLRVVANSEGLRDMALESMPKLDIGVIRNGIDTELYAPPADERRGRDRVRVVYIGRLKRHKRVAELVRAWPRIAKAAAEKMPDVPVEFCYAGFGPESAVLEKLALENQTADSVRYLGRLEEPEVVAALSDADIFVNFSEGEGLPNAVLEAMATGLPVVLSDIGPHRELVAEGGGRLLDPEDEEAIVREMVELLTDETAREKMGRNARESVVRNFSWRKAAEQVAQYLP